MVLLPIAMNADPAGQTSIALPVSLLPGHIFLALSTPPGKTQA
jgi:hypothetical protein